MDSWLADVSDTDSDIDSEPEKDWLPDFVNDSDVVGETEIDNEKDSVVEREVVCEDDAVYE